MRITTWSIILIVIFLTALLPQTQAADSAKKPVLLIVDDARGGRDYWNPLQIQEMLDAGYNVVQLPSGKTPTPDELKHSNVALVLGIRPDFATDLQPKLEKFMEQGGGVLVDPAANWVNNSTGQAPLLQWLKTLGATVYLHGVLDPERRVVIDWCKWPGAPEYVWTSEIAASPINAGVKTLWYRTGPSAYFLLLSAPMDLDATWTPLVFTGPNSRTISWTEAPYERDSLLTAELKKVCADFVLPQGKAQGRLPLVAVRSRGAGRLAVFSLNPQDFFWSGYIPAQGGVALHKGFKDRPSDGWKLLDNLYRWLAEPSLAGKELGGGVTNRKQLFREPLTAPTPYDWKNGAEGGLGTSIPAADPLLAATVPQASQNPTAPGKTVPLGLAGAHSAYSSGHGTVAEWVTAAKAAKLDFLIFMEDLALMNAAKWEKLKAECTALSDEHFLAYPGLEFKHELGNRGYCFNRQWKWLGEERVLTKDHRFIQTSRNIPDSEAGPLSLWLGYDQDFKNGTAFTLGFFSHQTNLTPAWAHRGFGSMAVFTRDQRKVVDDIADTLPVFLRLQNQKLVISPMALSLMSAPAEIAGAVQRGGPFVTVLGAQKDLGACIDFGGTYCYAGRASALCATTGPKILTWNGTYNAGYVIPRWNVARREEDFFVLDNYRFRVRLAAESPAGLKEILIYDGDQGLYRRFLPEGRAQFEATLDLSNDQSRHLVLVVKDQAGGIAVSPEIQTENWLNRHYLCSDRCNFGCGNEGQGAWFDHPGPYTTQQGPETELMARWSRPVVSADLLALRLNLERRFETAGACGYGFGNPWHAYYRTWPMEEMRITKTDYRWRGEFGGTIYYLEEYFPAALDSIWEFPKPENPFYPENRWTPDPWTANLPAWTRTAHEAWEVVLTDDVILQKPLVPALQVTKDYTLGQGTYEIRLGDRRLTGTLPGKGAAPLLQTGEAPDGGVFALTGENGKPGWCWLLSGKGLHYKLQAVNGKMTMDIGWPVPDGKAKKGTDWRWELFGLTGVMSDAALNELLKPSGFTVRSGTLVPGRMPLTFQTTDGAAAFRAEDLRGLPLEWLPLEVRGLQPRRTAYWRETGTNQIRPIGVDPDGVGRAVLWRGKHQADFFLGHPVLCSDPEIWYDAVRMTDSTWYLDVNNPTDRQRTAAFNWHPAWPGRGELPAQVKLPPGSRVHYSFKERAL